MKLELGCGSHPTPDFTHHDRWPHSPHVDLAFDLETLPWPGADGSLEEIRAFDVFEHLRPWKVDIQQWLDECWRLLQPGGVLDMRLPAHDHHYSYRDPTHYRVFHPETFLYWCPDAPGTVWRDFGRYYFGDGYAKWWTQLSVARDCGDLRFRLAKIA